MTSGIYKITNTLQGRVYVGSATNIGQRWYDHRKNLVSNRHENPHLQNAWNKYGPEAFRWEVVEEIDPLLFPHWRKLCEQYWIDAYKLSTSVYNIAQAGQPPTTNPEIAAKVSRSLKAYTRTSQHQANLTVALRGRKMPMGIGLGRTLSMETKEKIGSAHRGRPKSAEHKSKIALAMIGNKNRNKRG